MHSGAPPFPCNAPAMRIWFFRTLFPRPVHVRFAQPRLRTSPEPPPAVPWKVRLCFNDCTAPLELPGLLTAAIRAFKHHRGRTRAARKWAICQMPTSVRISKMVLWATEKSEETANVYAEKCILLIEQRSGH